jgi:hypothetical protein
MGFNHDKTNINRNGRPKGKTNQVSERVKDAFSLLLEDNIKTLQADFDKLRPNDRIRFIIDLAGYIIPKLKATELTTDFAETNFQPIDIYL